MFTHFPHVSPVRVIEGEEEWVNAAVRVCSCVSTGRTRTHLYLNKYTQPQRYFCAHSRHSAIREHANACARTCCYLFTFEAHSPDFFNSSAAFSLCAQFLQWCMLFLHEEERGIRGGGEGGEERQGWRRMKQEEKKKNRFWCKRLKEQLDLVPVPVPVLVLILVSLT